MNFWAETDLKLRGTPLVEPQWSDFADVRAERPMNVSTQFA